MQQAATWTGPQVFRVQPAGGAPLAGLISRVPALPTAREGARVSEGGDRSRVERARSGDREAYAELFRSYEPDVRRLCRRFLRQHLEPVGQDPVAWHYSAGCLSPPGDRGPSEATETQTHRGLTQSDYEPPES